MAHFLFLCKRNKYADMIRIALKVSKLVSCRNEFAIVVRVGIFFEP